MPSPRGGGCMTSAAGSTREPVIAGLGITEMGRVYHRTAQGFAADAVRLAVEDAGLSLAHVDDLLTTTRGSRSVGFGLQFELGLTDLRLLSEVQAYGSSAGAMVQYASMAVASGMVDVVACVFADAPLVEGTGAGAAYSGGRTVPEGFPA